MRAISAFRPDDGTTTSSWAAWMPLRIRVRKSAIGSVIDMGSPARLRHAGDEALVRELAQADAAQPELAVDRTRAPAAPAAAVRPRGVLGRAVGPHDHGCLGHLLSGLLVLRGRGLALEGLEAGRSPVAGEGHAESREERERLRVGLRVRRERHVEAAHLVDVVVVDLREDDLLPDAHRVVAAPVERPRVEAAEVAQAREGDRDEPVEELVRALVAQRDGEPDRHPLAELERGDGLARPADVRLLPRDVGQLLLRGLEHLGVLLGLADAHVERHLHQARGLHDRGVAELRHQGGADLVVVAVLDSCHVVRAQSSSAPERFVTRMRPPLESRRMPTRVGLSSFGSTIATLETWTGPSFSITPSGALGRPGVGRMWRLTMLTPST